MIIMEKLIEAAKKAREKAYCPYSGFSVGAALMTKSGKIYEGANIENSSFSATVCAERVALFSAIISGEREFSGVAIAGGKGDALSEACPPCGVCRQALSEFCEKDMKVYIVGENNVIETTLGELLPLSFSL